MIATHGTTYYMDIEELEGVADAILFSMALEGMRKSYSAKEIRSMALNSRAQAYSVPALTNEVLEVESMLISGLVKLGYQAHSDPVEYRNGAPRYGQDIRRWYSRGD